MFGIGPEELVLILIIALIVLGPERMPKVARDIGRVVGDLRRTSDELREEFLNADKLLDKAADAATPPAQAIPATTQPSEPATIPGETAFDREMREARERLKAQRDA
jgi:Tat protein translocase TatB subunit